MSRLGYFSLMAALGFGLLCSAALGVFTAPSSDEPERMSCEEWFQDPSEGRFELTECHLNFADGIQWEQDTYDPGYGSILDGTQDYDEVGALVFPPDSALAGRSSLVFRTSNPADLDLLRRFPVYDLVQERFVARYRDRLFPVATINVDIGRGGFDRSEFSRVLGEQLSEDFLVAGDVEFQGPSTSLAPISLALVLTFLLFMAWVTWLQMGWKRTHPHRPQTF